MDIKKIISNPIEQINPAEYCTAGDLLEAMANTGFGGKTIGQAYKIWKKAIESPNTIIFLGIAGAPIVAGMQRVIVELIRHRFIDVIVTVGSQMFHDTHLAFGNNYFQLNKSISDLNLRELEINRYYDVAGNDKEERETGARIQEIVEKEMKENYIYSTREFFEIIGKNLVQIVQKLSTSSIIAQAYLSGVPIYCPTLPDSWIGCMVTQARIGIKDEPRKNRVIKSTPKNIEISLWKDEYEKLLIEDIIQKKMIEKGYVILGGGVPRNNIQQIAFMNLHMNYQPNPHKYAVIITTDRAEYGGLSGSTPEECQSWGKTGKDSLMVKCICDMTIALPIISQALFEKTQRKTIPCFRWQYISNNPNPNLEILFFETNKRP